MLTLKRKTDMINAWSLAGSILSGTLDEEYLIKSMEDEELNPYEYYAPSGNVDLTVDSDVVCKYNEDQTLDLAKKYIESTYSQHYANGNFQTLDLIESIGDAEAFCRSNAIKYLSRTF